jgi:succinate dehydrogenase/fumarate reductase flavoprotein subunit
MNGYPDSPLAWDLTRGMARVLGASLPDAVVDGWLSRAELAQLVDRCAVCDQTPACTAWLSQARIKGTMPVFCPNKDTLEGLAIGH